MSSKQARRSTRELTFVEQPGWIGALGGAGPPTPIVDSHAQPPPPRKRHSKRCWSPANETDPHLITDRQLDDDLALFPYAPQDPNHAAESFEPLDVDARLAKIGEEGSQATDFPVSLLDDQISKVLRRDKSPPPHGNLNTKLTLY